MKKIIWLFFVLLIVCCKQRHKEELPLKTDVNTSLIEHAKGFTLEKSSSGITYIKITSPWPNSESSFTYALVPKEIMAFTTLNKDSYDAIVTVPVEKLVVTSTTHIPALESLGVLDRLIGFPDTQYISSTAARKQIDDGKIKELGNNQSINTEMLIALKPNVVVGFGINAQNKAYETVQRSNIPVVYNGDWTEETPLGKAEWIKFFAPFFQKEKEADRIFTEIEVAYNDMKGIVSEVKKKPTVLTGGLYKDVWHVAGGKSWMGRFLEDAQANYLWADNEDTGGVSVSLEEVIQRGHDADFWFNPSYHTSYTEVLEANRHYKQFDAFNTKHVFSNSIAKGETGGLLYYELAPQRPDLVLKDLIHILHPGLLPEHELFFFKPLE